MSLISGSYGRSPDGTGAADCREVIVEKRETRAATDAEELTDLTAAKEEVLESAGAAMREDRVRGALCVNRLNAAQEADIL